MNGNGESINESSLLALSQLKTVKIQILKIPSSTLVLGLVTKLSEAFQKGLFEDHSSSSAPSVLKARSCELPGV
jgi:hypothetical protein